MLYFKRRSLPCCARSYQKKCLLSSVASTSAQHGLHSNWVLRVPRVTDEGEGEHKALPDCANQSGPKKCNKTGSTSSRLRLQRNPIHLPKVVESALQTLRFRPRLKKHWGTFETNKRVLIHMLLAYLSVLWGKCSDLYTNRHNCPDPRAALPRVLFNRTEPEKCPSHQREAGVSVILAPV